MTQQLKQAITLAQSLSIEDQLKLLKTLCGLIQKSYTSVTQTTAERLGFSTDSLSQITPTQPKLKLRTPGQYAGKLVIPKDFNDPLPDDILDGFLNPAGLQ